jgi:hypothetical protein
MWVLCRYWIAATHKAGVGNRTRVPDLHGHKVILHYHVLGQEVGACLGVWVSALVFDYAAIMLRHTIPIVAL